MLHLACARVAGALEPRKGEFLARWVAGESIAGIAAPAALDASGGSTTKGAEGGTRTRTVRRLLAPQVSCSLLDKSQVEFGVGALICRSAWRRVTRPPR